MRQSVKGIGGILSVAILLASPCAGAQSGPTRVEIDDPDGVEAMRSRIFAFVEALTEYTADVRVSGANLEAILDHYEALDEIQKEEDGGGIVERAYREGRYDFGVIVSDPSYVGWARSRGLEPEPFFQGLLRLEALRMREEGLAGLERAQERLPAQRDELDAMRQTVGEEDYRRAVEALEAAAEMVRETRVLMARLPRPSPAEAALMAEHRDRIQAVLGDGVGE